MAIHRPCGTFDYSYYQSKAILRTRLQWGLLLAFIAFLYSFYFWANEYILSLLIVICSFVIGMLGLQIITGYAGQISIGHAAFLGVGMYTVGCAEAHLGLNYWWTVPLAGLVAAVVGGVFGSTAAKLKELYLAFATLAAHFIIVYVISNWRSMTRGTDGIWITRPTPILGLDFGTEAGYYLWALTACVLMTYFATNLSRSKLGRAFVAVRDNDIAANVMGINIVYTKMVAFAIGSFFAGIAGAVLSGYYAYVNIEWFTLDDSIWFLGFLVVGGFGSIFGAISGAVLWKLLDELVASRLSEMLSGVLGTEAFYVSAAFSLILYALIIIVFLVFEPRGIAHRWQIIKASYRLWPFSY